MFAMGYQQPGGMNPAMAAALGGAGMNMAMFNATLGQMGQFRPGMMPGTMPGGAGMFGPMGGYAQRPMAVPVPQAAVPHAVPQHAPQPKKRERQEKDLGGMEVPAARSTRRRPVKRPSRYADYEGLEELDDE